LACSSSNLLSTVFPLPFAPCRGVVGTGVLPSALPARVLACFLVPALDYPLAKGSNKHTHTSLFVSLLVRSALLWSRKGIEPAALSCRYKTSAVLDRIEVRKGIR
jgi:hypothetical protein